MTLPDATEPPQLDELDRYVKVTEAARILGYCHSISVEHLISRKVLKCYHMPDNNIKRILLSDLHLLMIKKTEDADSEKNSSNNEVKKTKRKRGRPPKFAN